MLRRKGKSRVVKETRGKFSKGKAIRKRDKSVYRREEAGHWEVDTVISGQGKAKHVLQPLQKERRVTT